MVEHLFIRLAGAQPMGVVLNGDGRVVQPARTGPLESFGSLAAQRRVTVLAPATDVVTTEAKLPNVSAARLRQMLPFSLEDAFAQDIEQLVFAPGQRLASGDLAVSVVDRQLLEAWIAELVEAGLTPDAIVAETDGVPDTPATLSLMLEGERVLGRCPGRAPFVFEGLDARQVAELVGSGDEGDLQHVVALCDEAGLAYHERGLAALKETTSSVDVKGVADGMLTQLAATLALHPGTNLLQGPYARKSNWRALAKPWHAAASLLAAALGIVIASQAVEFFVLARQDRLLTEMVTARCGQTFGANRLSTCASAVQRRLSDAGAEAASSGESFLTTLAAVAESYSAATSIEALSYRNEVMDLQLVVPDVPSLDTFAQQISSTERFDVRIQSANPSDDGVEGRLQIVTAER